MWVLGVANTFRGELQPLLPDIFRSLGAFGADSMPPVGSL
jgi:hypothetical protein